MLCAHLSLNYFMKCKKPLDSVQAMAFCCHTILPSSLSLLSACGKFCRKFNYNFYNVNLKNFFFPITILFLLQSLNRYNARFFIWKFVVFFFVALLSFLINKHKFTSCSLVKLPYVLPQTHACICCNMTHAIIIAGNVLQNRSNVS